MPKIKLLDKLFKKGAAQPADFPIVDGKPAKSKRTKKPKAAKPKSEPVVVAEPIPAPEPVKALPMCPENYPHLYDTFGNKL